MFASPTNNQQSTPTSDPLAYPTGASVTQPPVQPAPATQAVVPVPTPNSIQQQASTQPVIQPQTNTAPMTEAEKRRQELQSLINRQNAGNAQNEPVAVPTPIPPTPAPTQTEPTVPINQVSEVPVPTNNIPQPQTSENISSAHQITESPEPAVQEDSLQITPSENLEQNTEINVDGKIEELERRIKKLEETVRQWV